MPFEQYLQDVHHDPNQHTSYSQHDSDGGTAPIPAMDSSIFPHFRIPNFMYSGPPTLAPGGGAEVISPGSLTSPWFSNSGFNPRYFQDSIFEAPPKSYTVNNVFDFHPPAQLSTSSQAFTPQSAAPSVPPPNSVNDSLPFSFPVGSPDMSNPQLNQLSPTDDLAIGTPAAGSSFVLPVYSSSGFDLLPILARVVNRPDPKVTLGPVDLTCSFVVVDVRRYDSPIVYCSPTFSRLTGYQDTEVLGRNCRFLQSPDGFMPKGAPRTHSADAVAQLRKSLAANKECQTTIINYKKCGKPFINLVTVIPITGDEMDAPHETDRIVYHVGFQVDLTEKPNAIMEKLQDGSLRVNYSTFSIPVSISTSARDRKPNHPRISPMSKILRSLLSQSRFLKSLPITVSTTFAMTSPDKAEVPEASQTLNLILLEMLPDFIHVVSLKGSFLYVAPTVRHVLGYEPDELVGKSIAEFCHEADLVPLMRELKESSATPSQVHDMQSHHPVPPKIVDILFRARAKSGNYVWVESRGRLHVEPGKGRKAIILSGRAREMPYLKWESIAFASGLTPSTVSGVNGQSPHRLQREFWGTLSSDGTFLVVGAGIQDTLGWEVDEVIGKTIGFIVVNGTEAGQALQMELVRASEQGSCETSKLLSLRTKHGSHVSGKVVLYPSSPWRVICQVKLVDLSTPAPRWARFVHSLSANVFGELETDRGSSWQYELERLKFENQRLTEEIDSLETKLSYPVPPSSGTTSSASIRQPRLHRHVRQDIVTARMHSTFKRSWDSALLD